MSKNVVILLDNPESKKMIQGICKENDLVFDVFEELVQAEAEQVGKQRKTGLSDSFDDILDRIQAEE